MNKQSARWSLLLVVVLVALAWLAYGCAIPARERGRQIKTCANMQTLGQLLDDYREKRGGYPKTFAEAIYAGRLNAEENAFFRRGVDAWNHPLYYEGRKEGYVLVSFGRDGIPDGLNYWNVRESGADLNADLQACKDSRIDLIKSDKLFHRCCAK